MSDEDRIDALEGEPTPARGPASLHEELRRLRQGQDALGTMLVKLLLIHVRLQRWNIINFGHDSAIGEVEDMFERFIREESSR